MRAVTVTAWGQAPTFSAEVPQPPATEGMVQVRVLASGLHNVVRSQASGTHYSAAKFQLPYIPGSDGVGLTPDGTLVYFNSLQTGGGLGEFVNIAAQGPLAPMPIPIAADASDETNKEVAIRIAGLMNPAFSSWMAMTARTTYLPENFTCVIMGVTSLSGQIAVRLARTLGAGKVIGVARNTEAMAKLYLDEAIELKDNVTETDFKSVVGEMKVDIILDYIYGPAIVHLFNALPSSPGRAHEMETQYIQIGSLGGPLTELPSAILRSKNLTMRGAGPGSWSVTKNAMEQFPKLLKVLVDGVGTYPIKIRAFEEAEEAWADKKNRSVFVA